MEGELSDQATRLRTEGVEKVVAQHPGMKVIAKQNADYDRGKALDLMNNWLSTGDHIDAVAANNDEMAIGAILALQQAHVRSQECVVAGVDATPDALAEMAKGRLAVTVFQDARSQGRVGGRYRPEDGEGRDSAVSRRRAVRTRHPRNHEGLHRAMKAILPASPRRAGIRRKNVDRPLPVSIILGFPPL